MLKDFNIKSTNQTDIKANPYAADPKTQASIMLKEAGIERKGMATPMLLAKKLNVKVYFEYITADGYLLDSKTGPVVFIRQNASLEERMFFLGHEIGHLRQASISPDNKNGTPLLELLLRKGKYHISTDEATERWCDDFSNGLMATLTDENHTA